MNNAGSLGRALIAIQVFSQSILLCVLIGFPLVAISWDFATFFFPALEKQWPLLGHFLSQTDGGAQSEVARALLRSGMAAFCVVGLLLPISKSVRSEGWRSWPWIFFFLLCGLLSVSRSPHALQAFHEWLTWALLFGVVYILRRTRVRVHSFLAVAGIYTVSIFVGLHSLWLVIPLTTTRPGGVFYHSNILSTFCLILFPLLVWRSRQAGGEGRLASFLLGLLVALQFWTGSLTGTCVLSFALFFHSLPPRLGWPRYLLSIVPMALPAVFNLLGGSIAAWCNPLLFVGLLCLVTYRRGRDWPKSSVFIAWFSLLLVLFCLNVLAPSQRHAGTVHNRENSAAARLEFYRAGVHLWLERPLLGQGPSAFAREYPRYQSSIRYYSKFVHCLPLEFASEWGGAGFVFLILGLISVWPGAENGKDRAVRWATGLFFLHSLTGVQSQFPYLLLLIALAWGFEGNDPTRPEAGKEKGYQGVFRCALVVVLLWSISHSSWVISANFDRTLALKIYRERGPRAAEFVSKLFFSSAQMLPKDGLTWLQWGIMSSEQKDWSKAVRCADAAIVADPRWAAARKLKMVAQPREVTDVDVEEALSIDPVNYPTFYGAKAYLLHQSGDTEAGLKILTEMAKEYDPRLMSTLPDFRADDLEEQLVEYWLLSAILSEHLGQYKNAESNFRKALNVAQKRTSRIRKLLSYSERVNLKVGPLVTDLLVQVAEQVPAKDFPATIPSSPDQTVDL